MITILHGDNIALSRETFTNRKKTPIRPFFLRGGEFALTDLVQIFQGGELFTDTKAVYIEDFFLKTKKQDVKKLVEILILGGDDHEIVIWEGKPLTPSLLALFPKAKTEVYKLPSSLFTFLDSIKPGDAKSLLTLGRNAVKDVGEEIVVAMFTRHVRILLAIKEHGSIEEVKRLAPWQKNKLEQQAKTFSREELVMLHSELFTLDKNRKTGENAVPITTSIDFLLSKI